MPSVIGQDATASGFDPGLANPPFTFGAWGDSGDAIGVIGSSAQGIGVFGQSDGTGVSGTSPEGTGVSGRSEGTGAGVIGSSGQGTGVVGESDATGTGVSGTSPKGTGVSGRSEGTGPGMIGSSAQGTGVVGQSDGRGAGVFATSERGFGLHAIGMNGIGVLGISRSRAAGVRGDSVESNGVLGTSEDDSGVKGTSENGTGVEAMSSLGIGVSGHTFGTGTGVEGVSAEGIGVVGESSGNGTGVSGTSSQGIGVSGTSFSSTAVGVFGDNRVGGLAGLFKGHVRVTGNIQKQGGGFEIDHPLDPANRYLCHSFVESPDMMNVYNGNIITDGSGNATVDLPDYFEALNRDFCYQLTVIGQFAQAIVAKEVSNNRFSIQTDKPHVKVSWQVTGIRQDVWANAHRLRADIQKPVTERGKYLAPHEHGQPATADILFEIASQGNFDETGQST